MPLRKSKARSSKEAVTDQLTDRTDDLMAALEAAKEALARASAAAGRKGAELGKEASKAADKLMPERARQRRRAARRRRYRLLGVAGLVGAGVVASRLAGSKAQELRRNLKRQGDGSGGSWDRGPESAHQADPGSGAEVTQLHSNGGQASAPH
jgi:hypothetical protein